MGVYKRSQNVYSSQCEQWKCVSQTVSGGT